MTKKPHYRWRGNAWVITHLDWAWAPFRWPLVLLAKGKPQ